MLLAWCAFESLEALAGAWEGDGDDAGEVGRIRIAFHERANAKQEDEGE